jgi:D-aminopeptidase
MCSMYCVSEERRPRAREIGIQTGIFSPGELNSITDVSGVMVGHCTVFHGEGKLVPGKGPARTGVTSILPHSGNVFREKVPGAACVFNGYGKSVGLQQMNETGTLETPILLTNTLNVGIVADALVEWCIERNDDIGITTSTVNPVVGEVNDGYLNDIQGRHVRKEHVFAAIEGAKPSPVEEGSVGAGTGSSCLGWKGGIGTSSRVLPESLGGYAVGVLVQSNFGGVLTVDGVPVGRRLGRFAYRDHLEDSSSEPIEEDGSVMVVAASDAPLDHRQLRRLAARASLGLARTGFYGSNGSGDFFLAFSTALRIPHEGAGMLNADLVANDAMSALFLAVVEATEEAVLNSMLRATTVVGRDGHVVEAINIAELLDVMREFGRLVR